MIIEFSHGKIIANQHEVVIRLVAVPHSSLQAQVDCLTLIGRGANVITAHDMGCQWSIKLDDDEQLNQLAEFLCLPVNNG
ncbi:DUF3389 family protein [Vibrio rumoiensis]|uniref:PTS sugar transporter subunit IIA n=1 Tax=Vibrio rumoiensis 1S-45 TaxID=1188252 RepID=A0A1E5E4C7_9VIBR|nr:DUF3389 family protein [Vibrio rumoiensis]OEF27614.1 PTS sugar transporter subunit IIA [Vibrio rumoiensis 1S-45]